METENCAGAIIYRISNKRPLFLLIKSSATGWWVFPKGHIEEGETLIETARREVFEETGISDLNYLENFFEKISFINHKGNQKNVHHFLFETKSENLKISSEHIEFKWLNFEDAHAQVDHENQKRILKVAMGVIRNARH